MMEYIKKLFDEDLKELAKMIAERQGFKPLEEKDKIKNEEKNTAD